MVIRVLYLLGLTTLLHLLPSFSYSDDAPPTCDSLEDYTAGSKVKKACNEFFKDPEHENYVPYSVTEETDLARRITNVLKTTKDKQQVFFISEQVQCSSLEIKGFDIALIGVLNNENKRPVVALKNPPYLGSGNKGVLIRYESTEGSLTIANLTLHDINIHMGDRPAKFREYSPIDDGMIDIEAAQNVFIDNLAVTSNLHKQAINFNCDGDATKPILISASYT